MRNKFNQKHEHLMKKGIFYQQQWETTRILTKKPFENHTVFSTDEPEQSMDVTSPHTKYPPRDQGFTLCGTIYPLVMTNIAMENPENKWRFYWDKHLFLWAIFHGYVK